MEISSNLKLTEEGKDLFSRILREQPDCCPKCGFSHDTHMFIRINDRMCCADCHYQLQEKDYFPDVIGE